MNKHHDELAQQFQLLMDVRNQVKQSLDISQSASLNGKQVSCLIEIDEWERETIQRIQQVAANARKNVNELITIHIKEISDRFEQTSVHIQQRQKEGDYLENDIERIKKQLDQLKNDIKHVNEKIRVDSTMSNNIEWDTLIYIVEEELPSKVTFESVQNVNKATKKKKGLALTKKFNEVEKFEDSSSIIFPTEQSASSKYIS
jgi:cell division protein FtsB